MSIVSGDLKQSVREKKEISRKMETQIERKNKSKKLEKRVER